MFKEKAMTSSLDYTLKNFLFYMAKTRESYKKEISNEYTNEEKNEFVYNCALNTIDEYILRRKCSMLVKLSTARIINLFKENFMLQQYEKNKFTLIGPSDKTLKIISKFEVLKDSSEEIDIDKLTVQIDEILQTSTF